MQTCHRDSRAHYRTHQKACLATKQSKNFKFYVLWSFVYQHFQASHSQKPRSNTLEKFRHIFVPTVLPGPWCIVQDKSTFDETNERHWIFLDETAVNRQKTQHPCYSTQTERMHRHLFKILPGPAISSRGSPESKHSYSIALDSQIHFNFSDAFAAERQHSARSLKLESQSHGHGCRRPRSRVHAGSSRQHGGMAAIRARGTADWDSHPGHGGPSSAPQSPPLRRGAVHRGLAGGTVGTFSMAVLSPTGCLCQCICSGRSGARSPG